MGFIDALGGPAQGVNLAKDGPFGDLFDASTYAERFPISQQG